MPNDHRQLYDRVCRQAREIALLDAIQATLEWDERTLMPEPAGPYRAEQIATMARLVHSAGSTRTSAPLWPTSRKAPWPATRKRRRGEHPTPPRRQSPHVKLPANLVEAISRATVLAEQAWREARR